MPLIPRTIYSALAMRKSIYIFLIILSFQCRERYNVPFKTPATGFLVVEGTINYGGTTKIQLSRTSPLDSVQLIPENSALVVVEGDDNSLLPLNDIDSGRYVFDQLPLNPNTQYRLKIITANNKEYVSDFRPVIITPEIDSLTWKRQSGGVEISVNSHDSQNNTHYYKWDYEETWKFNSAYRVRTRYKITPLSEYRDRYPNPNALYGDLVEVEFVDPITHNHVEEMYTCWASRKSSSIKIGATTKLSGDQVYVPIVFYPETSWELSVMYSIKATQYGISKEAYEFYQKMKKNSESLGTVFDAQPSDITGNIRCTSDPDEIVIGFIEAASSHEKRLFISNSDLPAWNYTQPCEKIFVLDIPILYRDLMCIRPKQRAPGYFYRIRTCAYEAGYIPYEDDAPGPDPNEEGLGWNFSTPECLDCRLRGSSQKPDFWP